jgi:hypothetical protein
MNLLIYHRLPTYLCVLLAPAILSVNVLVVYRETVRGKASMPSSQTFFFKNLQ